MRPPWQQPMPHCPLYPATNRWPDLWMVNEWRRTHNNNIIYVYESPELHPPIETRLPACLHFIFNLLIELHPKTKLHLFLVAIGISKYRYTVYTNVNPYVKLLTKNFCYIALYGFILHLEAYNARLLSQRDNCKMRYFQLYEYTNTT